MHLARITKSEKLNSNKSETGVSFRILSTWSWHRAPRSDRVYLPILLLPIASMNSSRSFSRTGNAASGRAQISFNFSATGLCGEKVRYGDSAPGLRPFQGPVVHPRSSVRQADWDSSARNR